MKTLSSITFTQPDTPRFCITIRKHGVSEYAVHWHNLDDRGFYDGRYFPTVTAALADWHRRVGDAITQTLACGGEVYPAPSHLG